MPPSIEEVKLLRGLRVCLGSILDLQVETLMQELFSVEELNNLRGRSRVEFLAELRQLNRLDQLKAKLLELHPDVYARFFQDEGSTILRENIFENRELELDKVFLKELGKVSQCLLVLGPAGYGKTQFLQELASRYFRLGWQVVFITITESTDQQELIKDIALNLEIDVSEIIDSPSGQVINPGWRIATRITGLEGRRESRDIVLLIDNLHVGKPSVIKELISLVEGLFDGWKTLGIHKTRVIRVISATRNRDGLDELGVLGKDPIRLTPFDFKVVRKSVGNFAARPSVNFNLEPNHLDELAAYLCYISGGHPGCLTTLLKKYYTARLFKGPWPSTEEPLYLNEVFDVADGIRKSIAPTKINNLLDILEQLSVIRKFSDGILTELVEEDWFSVSDAQDLWNVLAQTQLVTYQSGFLGDDITRRIFFNSLRHGDENKQQQFKNMCKFAVSAFESRLTDPRIHRGRHIFAIELLYHRLQEHYYLLNVKGRELSNKYLAEILPDVLNKLVSIEYLAEHKRGVVDDFLGALESDVEGSDWEFSFTLSYFTSTQGFSSSAFQTMIEQVHAFRKAL